MLSKRLIPFACLLFIFFFSSCSTFLESTRTLVGDGPEQRNSASQNKNKWVSSKKYNDLQREYERLSAEYEKLRGDAEVDSPKESQAVQETISTETVDVFAQDGLVEQATQSSAVVVAPVRATNVKEEVELFKNAKLLKSNNSGEALKVFQYLEKSSTPQVRVHAKTELGIMYLEQEQYDLALQVFDSVIRQDAFSAQTLTALEKALVCCDKLGLEQKKAQYQSILKDFFEINV